MNPLASSGPAQEPKEEADYHFEYSRIYIGVLLLKTILIPWWTYRTLFLAKDSMLKALDAMCLRFVLMVQGMEVNKIGIHKS